MHDIESQFGGLDIYLFDQLVRGRIAAGMTVLDAGCGRGRNIAYLLSAGYQVFAVDQNRDAIETVAELAAELAPRLPADNFRVAPVEALPLDDQSMDVVISSAVLHFATDEEHLWAMLQEMMRVLKPGGLLFARLASTIGMEGRFRALGNGRYQQPDGDERFLVDEPFLLAATERLGGELIDPLKTTVVQDKRCMTTWVVRKQA